MSSTSVDEYDEIFASEDAFLAGLSDTDLQPSESLLGAGYVIIYHFMSNLCILIYWSSSALPAPSHPPLSASVLVQDSVRTVPPYVNILIYCPPSN